METSIKKTARNLEMINTNKYEEFIMKKNLLVFLLVLTLLSVSVIAVAAETGSVTINGGSLSVVTAPVTFAEVTLTGADQTTTSTSSWTAVDPTGTGSGWNLTIIAEDFTNGDADIIDISAAGFEIQLTEPNISVTAGNTEPVSAVTSLTQIPTTGDTALKFLSAALDTGMGTYVLAPNFSLKIPAATYAGIYNSTMTITAASSP